MGNHSLFVGFGFFWGIGLPWFVFNCFVKPTGINYAKGNLDKLSDSVKDNAWPVGSAILLALAVGFAISAIYMLLMQRFVVFKILMDRFAGKMIIFTGVVMILINLALAVFTMLYGSLFGGIILLLFTLLYGTTLQTLTRTAYLFYSWRHRIPFAKVMLKTVTRVTGQFPATLFSGFLGLILQLAFMIVWVLTIAGWVLMYNDKKLSQGGLYGLGIYLVMLGFR